MNVQKPPKLILASNSPRRRELLTQIGLKFEILSKDVDETTPLTLPEELVMELSCRKAAAAADDLFHRTKKEKGSATILGADTIVCCREKILGKPKDASDAFHMLKSLSGATHQVYTGVTLIHGEFGSFAEAKTDRFFARTDVSVFPMSDREIRDYIATMDPMDKAGAYGIQGPFAAFVKEIRGDYNNVVGLPVSCVYQTLKSHGWLPEPL